MIQKDYKTQNNALIAQEFYNEYQKSKSNNKNENIYPLIKVKNTLCAFLTSSDEVFMAVLTEDVPVLTIYYILFALIDIMKNAFNGQISAEKTRNNFSSILVVNYFIYLKCSFFIKNKNGLIKQDVRSFLR